MSYRGDIFFTITPGTFSYTTVFFPLVGDFMLTTVIITFESYGAEKISRCTSNNHVYFLTYGIISGDIARCLTTFRFIVDSGMFTSRSSTSVKPAALVHLLEYISHAISPSPVSGRASQICHGFRSTLHKRGWQSSHQSSSTVCRQCRNVGDVFFFCSCYTSEKNWGDGRDSDPQPPEPQSGAPPVELPPPCFKHTSTNPVHHGRPINAIVFVGSTRQSRTASTSASSICSPLTDHPLSR